MFSLLSDTVFASYELVQCSGFRKSNGQVIGIIVNIASYMKVLFAKKIN